MAALLAGQSVSAVAKQYDLPKGTVSNWKTRTPPGVSEVVSHGETQKAAERASEKASKIGDLLIELLESNIRGLISASSVLRDQSWVRQQNAAELGTFIGITHDKVVRMLEAMDRASPSLPASDPAE